MQDRRLSRNPRDPHMKAKRARLIICAVTLLLSGCVSFEGIKQAQDARQYMTEDLQTQIMFNLIRAKNGMPFAQYDIQQLQAVVSSKASPQGSLARNTTTSSFPGTRTTTTNGNGVTTGISTVLGTAAGAVETIVRPYGASFGYERDNTLTVTINPVSDNPSVYSAYIKCLNIDNDGPYKARQTPSPIKEAFPVREKIVTSEDKDSGTIVTTDAIASEDKPALKIAGFCDHVKTVVASKSRPAEGTYVKEAMRFWDGEYYYIPICYISQFADLWLALVAKKSAAGGASGVTSLLERQANQSTNIQNSLQQMTP